MKVVIPGGTGQIGQVLAETFQSRGDEAVILSRSGQGGRARGVQWDGKTVGDWATEIDGADVVINLAGRTVNCRYTEENLREMMSSRVDSTRAIGQAIAGAKRPPRTWLQMSTATIYAHRFDAPNDETTGIIGGDEAGAPAYWKRSVDIGKAWEREQEEAATPSTRKVALRTTMMMSPDDGGIFDVLFGMVRKGLGGAIAGGAQYVSWIHDADFVRAIDFLIAHDEISGAVNLGAPNPLPQKDFMRILREASDTNVGLPATAWMAEIGAFFLRTDTELLLKSRRVVPARLLDAGFTFTHPTWNTAAVDLVRRKNDRH